VFRPHGNRVAVARDASMLVPRFVLAGRLALEHLAVLWDAVAVALGDGMLAIDWISFGGCPGEVVTSDLNVVVRELTKLVIVHTEKFRLLGCAELETRDLVDAVGENSAYGERVGRDSDDIGDLLVDGRGRARYGTA